MRDVELYERILGLSAPWSVDRVELGVGAERVDVYVTHGSKESWACPRCERALSIYDHSAERSWRHLDTCQFETYLHARIPRVECPDHGVLQVKVPWAEERGRFTILFERFAIDVLQQCATSSSARRLLRISWDECWGILDRAVSRGLKRKSKDTVPLISIDEKAARRGHDYVTVVSDFARSTVEYVGLGRKQETLASYWKSLTADQLEGVEGISMDMWEPYVQATVEHVPAAREKIVFDRFHIMKQMTHAVDLVRRRENRELQGRGKDTLKGTRYLWLFSEENVPDRWRVSFEILKCSDLKVARAWAIKESLRRLWNYSSIGWARNFFTGWYQWAMRSRLEPVKQVAQMIWMRLDQVLNFCRIPITSAVAEGLNSKITAIKARACGYRNREHFKTAIYFFCGGLDLYPR